MIVSRYVITVLFLGSLSPALRAAETANVPQGQVIQILDIGNTGTTPDSTIFRAEANPTAPSTGTGVFRPFVRTQATGRSPNVGQRQSGYNTDVVAPATNFDTKGGSLWTRSIQLGEVGRVLVGGVEYYQFALDANEEGGASSVANQIDIVDIQIFLGSDPLFATPELGGGYTGTPYDSTDNSLLNAAPVWSLDNAANGDVTVVLQASICGSNGQCGSGRGDLEMLVPAAQLTGQLTDFLVFYVEYDRAANPSGGFEEWSTRVQPCPGASRAECIVLGAGCSQSGFLAPTLTNQTLPIVGQTLETKVTSPDTPGELAIITVGDSDTFNATLNVALPFDMTVLGMPGCTLYCGCGTAVFGGILDSNGCYSRVDNLPNNTALCGMSFCLQGFVGTSVGPPMASNGLKCTLGN